MASKRKVALSDYDMTTTLGTGIAILKSNDARVFRKSQTVEKQKDWRVLCHEDFEKGRYHQAQAGGPCNLREHNPRRH